MSKIKKIGILTQPLHDNYGGLLQAYALKEVLQDMDKEVVIINRQQPSASKIKIWLSVFKNKLFGRRINPRLLITDDQKRIISKETIAFREKYIPHLTFKITNKEGMLQLNKQNFDAYVVGSDQSWRPRYSPMITNYFLDFANDQKKIKRISYAVSFGVSNWEFNDEETRICKKLLEKFDAISVREDSGVTLVRDFLGRNDAIHVIDPTMLLKTQDYINIAKNENTTSSSGNLKVYVLDKNDAKKRLINKVERELNLTKFEVLPEKRIGNDELDDSNVTSFVYPNPAQWLKGFQDAKFVITDSFHGTVFSILHNIPFLSVGNPNRGMARFESLLKMFGLEDRLVHDPMDFDIRGHLDMSIDWTNVNKILDTERKKAVEFLKINLD